MSISTSLILRKRLHHLRSSLTVPTPFPLFSYRLLSTAPTFSQPKSNPHFDAVDYLVRSCRLSSEDAVPVSKHIRHFKSPDQPDSVLHFLTHTGISQSHITAAVSRDSRILCSRLETNWRPNVAKLQQIGLSLQEISALISRKPTVFNSNFVPKINFWMQALGSLENMSVLLKFGPTLLHSNLEKVIVPNLLFLQEQCGLSVPQIVPLIKSSHRLIITNPETLKTKADMAHSLGVARSSGLFVYALVVVGSLNPLTIDARLNNFRTLGLSQEELTTLVSRCPNVLLKTEQAIGRKMEFLIKEVGCDKLHVVTNPVMLTLSFEKRLVPRSLVWKLLKSKVFRVMHQTFASFVKLTEKQFLEKYIVPYEHAIPSLRQAYTDASSGETAAMNHLITS